MGAGPTKQKTTEGQQVKSSQHSCNSVSLHEAVLEQDAQAVRYCLQNGADVSAIDDVGDYTALHLAATNDCKEITLALLENGADVNAVSKSTRTALHVAALSNASAVVSVLLRQGADVNATDMWGRTALHYSSNKEVTAQLLKRGANANIRDRWGQSPLHFATWARREDAALEIVRHGGSVNAVTNNGDTVLHLAIRSNSNEVAIELLRRGADVNKVDKHCNTALHMAAKANSKELVTALLLHGADISVANNSGRTALHLAATVNNQYIAVELLGPGANVNVQDIFGSTPLHLAAIFNAGNAALEFVQRGADVTLLDNNGQSALHMTALTNKTVVAKVILQGHPNTVNMKNKDGQTALHIAATEGSKKIVELLLKNNADVTSVDNKGNSVSHLAFSNKRYDCIPLLLEDNTIAFNIRDINGNTLLHSWAKFSPPWDANQFQALTDYAKCGDILIRGGAVVNARNSQDRTPLHVANNWKAVTSLVDNGAWPNVRELHYGETPLLNMVRSLESHTCLVYQQQDKSESEIQHWQKILRKGLDVWIASDSGETVLSVLLNKKNVHLAYALVTALTNHFKHDVNKKHTNGLTILHIACACGNDELQEMIDNLLKNRANVNEPSTTKETPLHFVCRGIPSMEAHVQQQDLSETMHFWTACRLLSYGADPSLQDDKGMSSFDIVEDIPQMFDLLSKPVDPGSIPPLLKWSDPKSETHRAKVAQVVRGHNSMKIHFYHYHKEPIGSGAFGHVYAGIDERNGMEVAVKRIEKQRILRPETRREIANLVKLRECEEAVRYIGHYEDDHFVYLILDLMEGMLEEYLDTSPRYVKQDTSLCHDMVKGLTFLHQNNVLHRDIKPGNILYKTCPRVCLKLADFGLSTKITTTNDTTATWTVMHNAAGTRCWMAPELLQGDIEIACSEASDVFACGLVIHFILTGKKHPFAPLSTEGRSNIDIKNETERNIMSYELAIDTGLSHEASHVITTMLLQDKSSRPNAATVLCHPFFWSKTKMSRFIEAVGNQPEIQMPRHAVSKPSPVEWQLENTLGNEFEAGPWESSILEEYLEMASCGRGRRYDTYSAVDLVRFVRNSYAHVSDATRSLQSQKRLLDEFVYFSTFPSMLMDVYNAVTAHGWDKQRGEIKRVLEME